MAGKITTVLAKKEAEAYRSQGLHQEAARLFTELLTTSPNIDPEIRAALESQIQGIQAEMADADRQRQRRLTTQEIVRIRDGWGDSATEADLLVCAQAFAKIGAHDEALKELGNLLGRGHLKKIYLAAAADSFVQLHSPGALTRAVVQWTEATRQPPKAVVAMQLALAKHMAFMKKWHHALAMYRHLHHIPALAQDMKRRIDELTHRLKEPAS